MDAAIRNAIQQQKALLDERARLSERVTEVTQALAKIDRFIAEWKRFAGEIESADEENPSPQSRPVNPTKEEVGDIVARILDQVGQPMGRGALFDALRVSGVELQGKDPQMVLSTMLWRMQGRFIRIPKHGYWIKDKPYAPAGYQPDLEDLLG